MKLKYDLEIMEMGDQIVAVPVGNNANELHAMINLNKESKEVIELIKLCSTPDEVLNKLLEKHPEEERNELGNTLCDFLNQMIKEGLLIP